MLSSGWVAWNSIVVGYAQIGKFVEALQFYGQFRRLPMRYEFSLVSVLIVSIKREEEGTGREKRDKET